MLDGTARFCGAVLTFTLVSCYEHVSRTSMIITEFLRGSDSIKPSFTRVGLIWRFKPFYISQLTYACSATILFADFNGGFYYVKGALIFLD